MSQLAKQFGGNAMIITRNHGEIRELQLDRPPANALNRELMTELRNAIDLACGDGARAIVLSGRSGMFSAGLDIPLLLKLGPDEISQLWKSLYALLRTIACSSIPIVAAVTGHAPAGGTVLMIFCDWRVVPEGDWKIGLSEVQVGLPLPPVILQALRRSVGPQQAQRLATFGTLMSSPEAAAIGLADEIVPLDQVVPSAIRWCESLLSLPQSAVLFTRRHARADLASIFTGEVEKELAEIANAWWEPETQSVLRQVADRLTRKKS